MECSELYNSTFAIRHSSFLVLAGIQFLAEKPDLFLNGAVLFQPAFDAVNGMQGGGMISVEGFADGLQRSIRVLPSQVDGYLPRSDKDLFAGA